MQLLVLRCLDFFSCSTKRNHNIAKSSNQQIQNQQLPFIFTFYMEPVNPQLFVYGSLRSGFNHPAYAYISTHFALVGSAKVKGRLYDLGSYPAALPTNDETYILGELYVLKAEQEFSWAIAQIDDYEGVNPEPGETALYVREITTVYIGDQTTTAWIYWYNNGVEGKPQIASGDVLEYLQQKKP